MIDRMLISVKQFVCGLRLHAWTCAAGENIPPTQKQLDDGIDGFNDYATMYCKKCGKVYVPRKYKR